MQTHEDIRHEAEQGARRRDRNRWIQDTFSKARIIWRICRHLIRFGAFWPWQDIIEIIEEIPDLDNELTEEFEGSE